MTQFAKEEIRSGILAAAKEEFERMGFEKASIRTIAQSAGTAKSNLYNYFPDKDALFCAVLENVTQEIRQALAAARAETVVMSLHTYTPAMQAVYMRAVMTYIAGHAGEIALLLFQSGGSSLQDFKDEVTGEFTEVLRGWFCAVLPGREPSALLIRCVANFYIIIIEQMLRERSSPEQAEKYMAEFLRFVYGGWHALME